MNRDTQEQVVWLVEGELDSDERLELFRSLDQEPDGWKKCALAFMERDALMRSLGELRTSDSPLSGDGERVAGTDPSDEPGQPLPMVPEQRHTVHRIPAFSWLNVTLAATLLGLLFTVGYWAGDGPGKLIVPADRLPVASEIRHPMGQRLARKDPNVMLAVNRAINRVSVDDGEIVALISCDANVGKGLVPVIESKRLNRQFAEFADLDIPTAWARKMSQAGWEFDRSREFFSVHLPDGTNEIMPISLLNCRFVGKPLF